MQLSLSVGIKNDEFLTDDIIDVFNVCFYEKHVSGETISAAE